MKFLTYWGLERNPFDKDVKPTRLTQSYDFTQASAGIAYLFETGGVGLLTGRSGNGKTTIVRAALDTYPPGLIRPYYLELSTVKVSEFYKMLSKKLGLLPMRLKSENFQAIQAKFRSLRNDEKIMPILILDEAQYLCRDILIDLPILMNFDMDSKNFATLLLVGLPYLNSLLDTEQYECLRDRLVFNYDIGGMTLSETASFIQDRLSDAGISRSIFDEAAVTAAHSASKNSFRRLCQILTKALMIGCSRSLKQIDAATIHAAVDTIKLGDF